jgi:hypothetical protein
VSVHDPALGLGPAQEQDQAARAVPPLATCKIFWICLAADEGMSAATLVRTDLEVQPQVLAAHWPEERPPNSCRTDRASCPRVLALAMAAGRIWGVQANRELVPITVCPARAIDPISVDRDSPMLVVQDGRTSDSPGVLTLDDQVNLISGNPGVRTSGNLDVLI